MKKCPKCLSERITKTGDDRWLCETCRTHWTTCGNCDVPGLIHGSPDDCVVCDGTSFVALSSGRRGA